ncbi:MAG: hypothetical protein FWC20_12015 [Oscillospiraceae bacterium]|nr:hypothetical protein [Oscillospiraceae bacterium]MCL2280109.1 hypothetical protein [Oscillospiraceae bacterium]
MSDIVDYRPYMENDFKVYVSVTAETDKEGSIVPLSFVWEDDTRYEIDKILDVRPAAALRAGGVGLRYSILVRNRQTYIFLEETKGVSRWFMERK